MNDDRNGAADLEMLFFSLSELPPDARRKRLAELTAEQPHASGIGALLRRLFANVGAIEQKRTSTDQGV